MNCVVNCVVVVEGLEKLIGMKMLWKECCMVLF